MKNIWNNILVLLFNIFIAAGVTIALAAAMYFYKHEYYFVSALFLTIAIPASYSWMRWMHKDADMHARENNANDFEGI